MSVVPSRLSGLGANSAARTFRTQQDDVAVDRPVAGPKTGTKPGTKKSKSNLTYSYRKLENSCKSAYRLSAEGDS